ncbi:MAG TPA: PilN domain-containing protein [Acidobacteriaceae bacterium]|nr:PilN domain-containing protein [Acidobacteriaceae bacterium]
MKITLNLASQPYVDVRSVLRRLRLLMLVLVVLAVPLFLLLRREQGKAQQATDRVTAVKNHVQMFERQQRGYEALMRQPQNAAVLNTANTLNGLFRRKSFSWTATMTDLETVLPAGVQVVSLDPAIMKNGDVVIHLRVSGARDRAIELIQNLEKSRHFASPRLAGESMAQGSNPNNQFQPISATSPVNFDILADYRPLTSEELEASEHSTAKPAVTESGPEANSANVAEHKSAKLPRHKRSYRGRRAPKPSASTAKKPEAR